jgi:hypothetical protein
VVLDSAEPAAICFTSGFRHTFLATADLLQDQCPLYEAINLMA